MTSLDPGRTWASAVQRARINVTTGGCHDRATRPTSMFAHWSEEDPAAVVLAVEDPWTPDRQVIEWTVARNVLIAAHLPGLAGEIVGLGDFKVRHAEGLTTIWLRSPEGCADLAIPGETLTDLLREAAQMCPLGEPEAAVYADAVDRDLTALFGQQS